MMATFHWTLILLSTILTAVVVHSASIGHAAASDDIKASVDRVQKSFSAEKPSTKAPAAKEQPTAADDEEMKVEESVRQHKMFDYFGYVPQPMMAAYPTPFYPSPHQSYYEDYNHIDEEEGMMSRANRRKPASSQQNSPIFYIRLPPTPYMFVPGMGYISQPPTIQPIATQFTAPPPQLHRVPVNPFINLPVSFLSNGKPTNVYQWGGSAAAAGGHQPNAISGSEHNGGPYGSPPQFPSYLQSRPVQHRPSSGYRPHQKPYLQDSKIHHLKGPYVFNGRPEEVFVLPNSPYSMPFNPQYTNEYGHQQAAQQFANYPIGYNTPYNSAFSSTYADPIQSYY